MTVTGVTDCTSGWRRFWREQRVLLRRWCHVPVLMFWVQMINDLPHLHKPLRRFWFAESPPKQATSPLYLCPVPFTQWPQSCPSPPHPWPNISSGPLAFLHHPSTVHQPKFNRFFLEEQEKIRPELVISVSTECFRNWKSLRGFVCTFQRVFLRYYSSWLFFKLTDFYALLINIEWQTSEI